MKFQVILPKSVQKEMDRLPDEIANRILARLVRVGNQSASGGSEETQGTRCVENPRGRLPRDIRNPRPHFADHRHHRRTQAGNLSVTGHFGREADLINRLFPNLAESFWQYIAMN